MGIRYVFKDGNDDVILNKGISNKNTSIHKIKYENGLPVKLIADNMEYDFCFDDKGLKEISHRDSGFYIYKSKNNL